MSSFTHPYANKTHQDKRVNEVMGGEEKRKRKKYISILSTFIKKGNLGYPFLIHQSSPFVELKHIIFILYLQV